MTKVKKDNLFNICSMLNSLIKNKQLMIQLVKREIISRYRGSFFGVIWSVLTPLLMLAIYTFFFSVILESKWGTTSNSKTEFALLLFCGLTTFNLFSDTLSRSPSVILNHSSYVKKVVFPLEILPLTLLGTSIYNFSINILILFTFLIINDGTIYWTAIFLPIVVMPLFMLTAGFSWFISSLGVYFRDINQFMTILMQALMFLSPIFYPVSIIPEKFQFVYYINPLSYVVEDMRRILIWGQLPNWEWLLLGTIIGGIISYLGYYWFQKTRGGFADVL